MAFEDKKECKADVGFVIDHSSSIIELNVQNWIDLKNFIKNITSLLFNQSESMRFAANIFSDKSKILFNLNTFNQEEQYLDAIDKISLPEGKTNMAAGLKTMLNIQMNETNGNRENSSDIILLLTDGQPNVNEEEIPIIVDRIHRRHIDFFVLSIGNNINERALRNWARDFHCSHEESVKEEKDCRRHKKKHRYSHIHNFHQLKNTVKNTVNNLCKQKIPKSSSCQFRKNNFMFFNILLILLIFNY